MRLPCFFLVVLMKSMSARVFIHMNTLFSLELKGPEKVC